MEPVKNVDYATSYFDRTLFIPDEAKRQVDDRLTGYLDEAVRVIREIGRGDISLYLAGSLARGEGAVMLTSTGYTLASDLDFVAVVPEHHTGPDAALALVDHLKCLDPGFLPTCFLMDEEQVARTRSHFGHDLRLGTRTPLLRGAAGRDPNHAIVGRKEALEVVVHQLAEYLLTSPAVADGKPGIRDSTEHQLRKLLLELIRANVTLPGGDVPRYADLVNHFAESGLGAALDHSSVRELVRARELTLANPVSTSSGQSLAIRLLQLFFGTPVDNGAHRALLEAVRRHAVGRHDVLNLFQACVVAYCLLLWTDRPSARDAASLLQVLWRQLNETELIEAGGLNHVVASLSPDALAERESNSTAALEVAMKNLRLDYYHYLGPYNFGKIDYPAYSERA
ncbi:hypothetical protein ACFYW6_17900 [Streptomyces sp. NPDC002659]|uniref:hypothetical protein n=1 Tax=Streptomyces sp. NPDC002659 TaxID=3364656 RepID=UPI0036CD833F